MAFVFEDDEKGGFVFEDEQPKNKQNDFGYIRPISERNERLEAPLSLRKRAAIALKPYLPMALSAVGGVLAAPAAPETAGMSSVAGAGLGYAMGEQALDLIYGKNRPLLDASAKAVRDVAEGSTYEMGGQLVRPIVKGAVTTFKSLKRGPIPFTKKASLKKAGELLIARTSGGDIFAKNAKEAAVIEQKIPGLKFRRGASRNDPKMIKAERSLDRAPGKTGYEASDELAVENKILNDEAIRQHYKKMIPGKRDDFIKAIEGASSDVDNSLEIARKEAARQANALPISSPQQTGGRISSALDEAMEPVKKTMEELETQIPKYPMNFTNTKRRIASLLTNEKLSIDQRNAIKRFSSQLKDLSETGENTFTAMGVNRTLNDSISKALASGEDSTASILLDIKSNGIGRDISAVSDMARTGKIVEYRGNIIDPDRLAAELERNITRLAETKTTSAPDVNKIVEGLKSKGIPSMMQKGEGKIDFIKRISKDYERSFGQPVPLDETTITSNVSELQKRIDEIRNILSEASPGQDVAAAMNAYNQFASTKYFNKFDRGGVKQALSREGLRQENIPNIFKTPSGADDLINALGSKEKAAEVIKYDLNNDLLKYAQDVNGDIHTGKLKKWLLQNGTILDKYGLRSQYSNVEAAQEALDMAARNAKEFQKNAAASVLKADPEKIFDASLTGSNLGKKARELRVTVGANKDALHGLQNAFADHLISTLDAVSTNPLKTADKINKTFARYAPAMREIYRGEPEKMKALIDINRAINIASRSLKSPIGGGSDTAENFANSLFKAIAPHGTSMKVLATVISPLMEKTEREVTNLFIRASFDPDLAKILIDGATRKTPQKVFEKRLDKYFMLIGKVGTSIMGYNNNNSEVENE